MQEYWTQSSNIMEKAESNDRGVEQNIWNN